MIKLKLKDGSVREIEKAMPASEIIKDIGMGLYRRTTFVKNAESLPPDFMSWTARFMT